MKHCIEIFVEGYAWVCINNRLYGTYLLTFPDIYTFKMCNFRGGGGGGGGISVKCPKQMIRENIWQQNKPAIILW